MLGTRRALLIMAQMWLALCSIGTIFGIYHVQTGSKGTVNDVLRVRTLPRPSPLPNAFWRYHVACATLHVSQQLNHSSHARLLAFSRHYQVGIGDGHTGVLLSVHWHFCEGVS